MGRLSGKVFGFPSGKAGDIIFRVRNGKPFFFVSSGKYSVPSTERVKNNNRMFAACALLSSAMLKIKVIREAWQYPGTTSYNHMMKQNMYCHFSGCLLIPGGEKFEAEIKNIVFDNNLLIIEAGIYLEKIIGEKRISLQGILQLTFPEYNDRRGERYIPLHSKDIDLRPGEPLLFEVKFDAHTCVLLSECTRRNLLLNLAVKDTQSNREQFSGEMFMEDC
jgi:hypothetical protein